MKVSIDWAIVDSTVRAASALPLKRNAVVAGSAARSRSMRTSTKARIAAAAANTAGRTRRLVRRRSSIEYSDDGVGMLAPRCAAGARRGINAAPERAASLPRERPLRRGLTARDCAIG